MVLPSKSAGKTEMPSRSFRGLLPCKLGHRRQKIPERPDLLTDHTRFDPARPASDAGRAQPPFVHVPLVAAERAGVREQVVLMAGAVVAGEEDQRLVVQLQLFE